MACAPTRSTTWTCRSSRASRSRTACELELRAEFINAFNNPYLATGDGQIVVNPTTSTFGQITASNQQNYARRAQLGVKFLF